MSKSICKNILYLFDALLLLAFLLVDAQWPQALLAALFFVVICSAMSYLNRSLYLVSSDRMTLPLLYLLCVLPYSGAMVVGRCHFAALMILVSLYHILSFIVEEKVNVSLFFISLLCFSCAAVTVPRLSWLVLPFIFSGFAKVREKRFRLVLMTVAAMVLPAVYIFAYDYLFSELDILRSLNTWAAQASGFGLDYEMSTVDWFYAVVMAISSLVVFFGALRRAGAEDDTFRRRESHFLVVFFLFSLLVTLLSSGLQRESLALITAIPWSFLFLSYLEWGSYGVWCRNVILLTAVSSLVFKAAEYI